MRERNAWNRCRFVPESSAAGFDDAPDAFLECSTARANGRFRFFDWRFDSRTDQVRIHGRMWAPASLFVGPRYDNPPGGHKTCLNTKLAGCEVTLERPGQPIWTLATEHRAAFEILTEDEEHGVAVVA